MSRLPRTRAAQAADPAETFLAWEAVEDLLAVVPDGPAKQVLRMIAAGWSPHEMAEGLGLPVAEVEALAARGRMRVLTAALSAVRR